MKFHFTKVEASITTPNNAGLEGNWFKNKKMSKNIHFLFRFDFWRDFDAEYDNVTHSTDLLNKEALREAKSLMMFIIFLY